MSASNNAERNQAVLGRAARFNKKVLLELRADAWFGITRDEEERWPKSKAGNWEVLRAAQDEIDEFPSSHLYL